jgi:NEDD8-activating enzyme E1
MNLQAIDAMLAHPVLGGLLAHPSVSLGPTQLYARGVYEAETRVNLARPIVELLGVDAPQPGSSVLLTINDKKLAAPLRVRLRLDAAQ